ncbi:hypothetical protein FE257_006121 [Aspergillus nanangensis]|uniref:Uncharacterized protein n=1 Tax=Aspergillus nanangensis TaxID=2582783 RepID=A0AAD4CP98_ASPNN|nr:hypothetical protein FE257_006121 [Aspergillus nanangensis]
MGLIGMCFYNQKKFACGDWSWTNFSHRCVLEYRTGETCGIMLVHMTELDTTQCRLCEKLETKSRRRSAEIERVIRWKQQGATFMASMDKSQTLIRELNNEIGELERERDIARRTLTCP